MLLFASHDPGARNHIWPIYQRAIAQGVEAEFLDLMTRTELLDEGGAIEFIDRCPPLVLLTGTSGRQEELGLVHACNIRGIPTVSVVEQSVREKFDNQSETSLPNLFFVTNQGCATELEMMGVAPERVVLTGSAHLEQVAHTAVEGDLATVPNHYKLEDGEILISFFCVPESKDAVDALTSLATLLPAALIKSARVIVRPHPRMSDKRALRETCARFDYFTIDDQGTIATPSLLAASKFSLSMASTVSLESLVLGVPSAFYQIDWDYRYHDDLYPHQEYVPRIRNEVDLSEFVKKSLTRRPLSGIGQIEYFSGALDRSWKALQGVIHRST